MNVTIDHRGGWYRWKVEIGSGRGNTFAEGKVGTFGGAREAAYAIVSVFSFGAERSKPGSLAFKHRWAAVEWAETQAAIEQRNKDVERDLRFAFAAGDARRAKAANVELRGCALLRSPA